ncbi:hypothetical protein OG792_09650 [Micromonospora sp. NBC_01699]|uniref:hypothetical protein n=1 Tax=Micromonospora sp. NBC_01699 TaxID=2975984 RepID=UPI002E344530|nr:hypothetical protein [Micromonospora sp. NBC_01699]
MTLPRKLVLVGCMILTAGLAGCGSDAPDDVASAGSSPSAPAVSATPPAATTPPADPSPAAAPAADDGCPPDVNLMFERLKEAKAIVDEINPSLTGIQEPTCADGWAVARTVVKDGDEALVLFKHDPATGRWNPVAAGTDGVCDGTQKVPAAVQTKLGPGC